MTSRRLPILANKEDANFQEALKLYEAKQYKKALKLIDQTLKKNKNHAESLALKGCILYYNGNKEEAEGYILRAVSKSPHNYLVDHLAGIYYRAVENYTEAAKWFKAAVDNGSPNKHLLRDLSVLQMQIRDFKGLVDSKQQYLEAQPGYRANWTGVAVASHLNKDYAAAVATLKKIEDIIRDHLQEGDRYEQSECLLYKNQIIAESGDYARALEELEKDQDEIRDKLSVMEYRAAYLFNLGQKKEAALEYRRLLQRNPDNKTYYYLLERALDTLSMSDDVRLKLYHKLAKFYPRSDPPKFIPLMFLSASNPSFRNEAKKYIIEQLNKGVPATFVNVKPLYRFEGKPKIIEEIVQEFSLEMEGKPPTVAVWTKYFLAQHYLHLDELEKASHQIDEAIDHSPTLVELYTIKARILKHKGLLQEASDVMEEGRCLDLQDRFINSKASKYLLRANRVDEAIDHVSLFTKFDKDAVNGCKDLHLMQVNWVLIESAEAYQRLYKQCKSQLLSLESSSETLEEDEAAKSALQQKVDLYQGLALKRFRAIMKIFGIFENDQFDFHSYCLRKGTPRDYIQTLKWEDEIYRTPIYLRMAKGLSEMYLNLYDSASVTNANNGEDHKILKHKKEKKTKSQMKKLDELIARVESQKDDPDPLGKKLVDELFSDKEKALSDLSDLVKPLLEQVKDHPVTWKIVFELYLRQHKYVLALQAIKSLDKLSDPSGKAKQSLIRDYVVRLRHASKEDQNANGAIVKVVEKGLDTAFPQFAHLEEE